MNRIEIELLKRCDRAPQERADAAPNHSSIQPAIPTFSQT